MPRSVIYSNTATDFIIHLCQNKLQKFYKTLSQPLVCKNSCLWNSEKQQNKNHTMPDRTLQGVCLPGFSLFSMPVSTTGILPTMVSMVQQSTYCNTWCSQVM